MKQTSYLDFAKQPGQTSTGIVMPADLPKNLQEKAGNIVKEPKITKLNIVKNKKILYLYTTIINHGIFK